MITPITPNVTVRPIAARTRTDPNERPKNTVSKQLLIVWEFCNSLVRFFANKRFYMSGSFFAISSNLFIRTGELKSSRMRIAPFLIFGSELVRSAAAMM